MEAFGQNVANLRKKVSAYAPTSEKADATQHAEALQALREVGPPAGPMYAALLDSLVKLDVGAMNRKKIKGLKERAEAEQPTSIHICKLETCHEEKKMKIVLAMDDKVAMAAITDSMKQIGAQVCEGAPPQGFLEEDLSQWIAALEKQ